MAEEEMSKQLQDQINRLQQMRIQLQMIIQQRQQVELRLKEIEEALEELDKTDEKKFIGAFSSLVELVLKKITQDFDIGTFGAGTFDTDKYRFIFCESGSAHVLVSILHPAALVTTSFHILISLLKKFPELSMENYLLVL